MINVSMTCSDDLDNVDDTFDNYNTLHLQLMKFISLHDSDAIAVCLAANTYCSEVHFIKQVIAVGGAVNDEANTLTKRLHTVMFMHFEFNKMYIYLKLKVSSLIDDIDSTVVISVRSIETVFKNGDDPICDNAVCISSALRHVANDYYNGIEDFISPDKKLAIYYLFIAYYLLKNSKEPSESATRKAYSDLLDMYIDANVDTGIVVQSFSKQKIRRRGSGKARASRRIYRDQSRPYF